MAGPAMPSRRPKFGVFIIASGLIAGGALLAALWLAITARSLVRDGVETAGQVVAVERLQRWDGEEHRTETTYAIDVRFQPAGSAAGDGSAVTFRSRLRGNPPPYAVGETVPVLYRRGDPGQAEIASFRALWTPSIVLAIIAAIAAAFAAIAWRRRRAS
jgi:hypothetical protein